MTQTAAMISTVIKGLFGSAVKHLQGIDIGTSGSKQ